MHQYSRVRWLKNTGKENDRRRHHRVQEIGKERGKEREGGVGTKEETGEAVLSRGSRGNMGNQLAEERHHRAVRYETSSIGIPIRSPVVAAGFDTVVAGTVAAGVIAGARKSWTILYGDIQPRHRDRRCTRELKSRRFADKFATSSPPTSRDIALMRRREFSPCVCALSVSCAVCLPFLFNAISYRRCRRCMLYNTLERMMSCDDLATTALV